jgi:hypothetical protein
MLLVSSETKIEIPAMQRMISFLLAGFLLVYIICGPAQADDRGHSAATELTAAKLKERLSTIPIGESVRLKMEDGTELRGRLSARGDDVFEVETPKPVTVSYVEVKSVKRIDVAPHLSNNAFSKGARKILIIVGVVTVLLIIAAVELRKS